MNRAQLIDDARALVEADKLSLDVLLNLLDYLAREDDYIAWHAGFRALDWLKTKLRHTKFNDSFQVGLSDS